MILLFILLQIFEYNFYSPNYKIQSKDDFASTINYQQPIKRVKGYDAYGDSINTTGKSGNPNPMWELGYDYYYWNGNWYRYNQTKWQSWRSLWDWGFLGYEWRNDYVPGEEAIQYYEEKPQSLESGIWVFLILIIMYILYIGIYEKKTISKPNTNT